MKHGKHKMKTTQYQPKTGMSCTCRPGQERDNCPLCEGTGQRINFAAIRARPLAAPTMTLQQANALIQRGDGLFRRAALAWERGQNSGDNAYMDRCDKQSDACQARAEALLEPLGISCDYPGLYPSLTVKGHTFYTVESAVSAALEGGAL